MRDLYDRLQEYAVSEEYPFHMPGHKRQFCPIRDPYRIDITEIDGFDNLHHAEGILLEAEQRAADLYGAEETYYLINGSTGGLLAALSAAVSRGGSILAARNCHKAIYHGIYLRGLQVTWIYPRMDLNRGIVGSVSPSEVEEAFIQAQKEGRKPQAVLLTSPTYDGILSDIRKIAEFVHAQGALLIVDEAHGAHLAMSSELPESAVSCGADMVINSLHKTLPSLTQTALLHVKGERVDRQRLAWFLGVYQTSSPSYVLMAGMDRCVCELKEHRELWYREYLQRIRILRKNLSRMRYLHLVDGREESFPCFAYDPTRIVISTENSPIGGRRLYQWLKEEYHLQMEMCSEQSITAISTVSDSHEGLIRLEEALLTIDAQLGQDKEKSSGSDFRKRSSDLKKETFYLERKEPVYTLEEAETHDRVRVSLADSIGRISGEFVYLYPPGIPMLLPGERIGQIDYKQWCSLREQGFSLQGLSDFTGETIEILC